ncbi:MAG: tetratricopeptide repeat protein [Pedosphaera sp.]|nr:tetratricopeptide repeat protein [Pedosphaera sp.]
MNTLVCARDFFLLIIVATVTALLCGCSRPSGTGSASGDEFLSLMNVGRSLYEKGDAAKAVEAFQKAATLDPANTDARLNLANAHLLAGDASSALRQAAEVLNMEPNSAAAHYLEGCAYLRLAKFEDAIKSLQPAKDIDRSINPVSFQLGRAFQGAGKFDDALQQFDEIIQFETNHLSPLYVAAHYNLTQSLLRLGRTDEAKQRLEDHQKLVAQLVAAAPTDASTYERCIYTQARVPFFLEQPDAAGIKVQFIDATSSFLGDSAKSFHGPMAMLDINHRGASDLFLREGDNAFRLLMNNGGKFTPQGEPLPVTPGAIYSRVLVGDLNTDRNEDVIVIGDKGLHAFRFATNGAATDATAFAGLKNSPAIDGALVDLDFTGKLDLLLLPPGSNSLRILRNLGNMYFKDITATSGVPTSVTSPRQLVVEDWNNDDIMDLLIARDGAAPQLMIKQRGGALAISNAPANWPATRVIASGDLNNDLRADLIFASSDSIQCMFNGFTNKTVIPLGVFRVDHLSLVDYDNDGWLDIIAAGEGLRVWRNLGVSGFRETTAQLGFDKIGKSRIDSIVAADMDGDCDTDIVVSIVGEGIRVLRNDGGNANRQLKIRLLGNRSNPTGLGVRIEATAGHWRTIRTAQQLPIEIGVGNRKQLDSVMVRWFDIAWNESEVDVSKCEIRSMTELLLPTGSCPYLYTWDGTRFRFISDILGAAPVGLPVAEGHYIEADPDEFVWIGNESSVQPRDGSYVLQITEELREVLYLDEARLVVVDHPPGTEIYPTDKLLPGKPFPTGELVALRSERSLIKAVRNDGTDVTAQLRAADGNFASPVALRAPQLRGLAEPFSFTLDFGPIDTTRSLVLGMTGWLRFGGGMANIGASHNPDLPFPFPVLEAQTSDGQWKKVDVTVGAPAGKTKRLFVDLTDKLPGGTRQLRLSAAFEIHWDQIALFEKASKSDMQTVTLLPDQTDLHWRGFSEFVDLPWTQPLTPDYDNVRAQANWRVTPSGWCTRYGPVNELIGTRDDALALINGGDELTLKFSAMKLPPKPAGHVRDFFLYSVGWDKDSDVHVKLGTQVEPLPYTGMDDQQYGSEPRPERLQAADRLMKKYNTRWVGPMTISRKQ